MQSITPPRPVEHHPIAPLVTDTVIGTVLIVGGVTFGVAVFATPLLTAVMPAGRLSPDQMIIGMAVWGLALVAPAGAILLGTSRLARILGSVPAVPAAPLAPPPGARHDARGRRRSRAASRCRTAARSPTSCSDRSAPPWSGSCRRPRRRGSSTGNWQLRTSRGWVPIESPLDRAVRDAERVRRWFGADDADFIVKVYAAVTAEATTVERTVACAVLTHDQLLAWVSGLPPQRTLTPGRQDRMLATVREAASPVAESASGWRDGRHSGAMVRSRLPTRAHNGRCPQVVGQ